VVFPPDRARHLKADSGSSADLGLPHAHPRLVRCRHIWLTQVYRQQATGPHDNQPALTDFAEVIWGLQEFKESQDSSNFLDLRKVVFCIDALRIRY
jgi:hypothetical protein